MTEHKCKHCGEAICYCCPECGENVLKGHAETCNSDPTKMLPSKITEAQLTELIRQIYELGDPEANILVSPVPPEKLAQAIEDATFQTCMYMATEEECDFCAGRHMTMEPPCAACPEHYAEMVERAKRLGIQFLEFDLNDVEE